MTKDMSKARSPARCGYVLWRVLSVLKLVAINFFIFTVLVELC